MIYYSWFNLQTFLHTLNFLISKSLVIFIFPPKYILFFYITVLNIIKHTIAKSKSHAIPEINTTLHLFLSVFSNNVHNKENIKTAKAINVETFKNNQNIIITSP